MIPVSIKDIRSGDVVIFHRWEQQAVKDGNNPNGESIIGEMHPMEESQGVDELVHRVIAIHSDGLVTRGDNNLCVDSKLVTADNLVGKVTHLERGKQLNPVHGGWFGLFRARLLRIWKFYFWKHLARFGAVPYQWLRSTGWVARFWHPKIIKLQLTDTDGTHIKYIYHRHTVARWWPQRGRFECQKPYDLVLRISELLPDYNK